MTPTKIPIHAVRRPNAGSRNMTEANRIAATPLAA